MAQIIRHKRTTTLNNPPATLQNGELAVGMNDNPPKLWVGTPAGVKLINISGEAVEDAPSDAVYGRSDGDWVQVAPFIISATAPPDPAPNQLWWDSTSGRLFVWFDDGTSPQWVVASPSLRGEVGPRGPQGQKGDTGDTGPQGLIEEAPIDGR